MHSQRIDLTNYLRPLALRILYRGPLSILAETGFASRSCSLLFLPSNWTRVSGLEAAAYGLRQHQIRPSLVLSFPILPSDRADPSQSPFTGIASTSRPSRSRSLSRCLPLPLYLPSSYSTSSPLLSQNLRLESVQNTSLGNTISMPLLSFIAMDSTSSSEASRGSLGRLAVPI